MAQQPAKRTSARSPWRAEVGPAATNLPGRSLTMYRCTAAPLSPSLLKRHWLLLERAGWRNAQASSSQVVPWEGPRVSGFKYIGLFRHHAL